MERRTVIIIGDSLFAEALSQMLSQSDRVSVVGCVPTLDAADTLNEPHIHQRGERQEQEAEARQDERAKGEVHHRGSGDPVHQQHDAGESGE